MTPTERVHAFDLRSVAAIRSMFELLAPGARGNLQAAAFVVYQSVRATMLAYLLEKPAGVDDATLVEELTALISNYLVPGSA